MIFAGTALLCLPVSVAGPGGAGLVNALFTATSAVCVTGLIVVDTGSYWSPFGQCVILALMQVGGLGIMTFSVLAIVLTGGRISYRSRVVLKESLNRLQVQGVIQVARSILLMALFFELAGFLLFLVCFVSDYSFPQACWLSLFHSVSAFCNAGFSIFPDSFMAYRDNIWVNATLALLIIAGGLGFTVILEMKEFRQTRRLSIHTRFVLLMTATLLAGGTVLIFLLETFKHPYSFQHYSFFDKLITAFFQSVTARTAGFNTVDIAAMSPASIFLIIILMFIGASPGGTGGGIKTTTFGALMATVISIVRGESDVNVLGRRLGHDLLLRSFTIALISVSMIAATTLLMTAIEGRHLMHLLFEVTSAFGTVGLSLGITPDLTVLERLLITMVMFTGRVGPLTLAMAMAESRRKRMSRYPEGNLIVG